MFEYKQKSTLHFVGIHAIHLDYESNCGAVDLERTYHCIQGEFLYCGLLTDGQLLVSEQELEELLPLLELQVFKVEGRTLYVHSDGGCLDVRLNVEHISTLNMEEDDEEMVFRMMDHVGLPRIDSTRTEDPAMFDLLEHLYTTMVKGSTSHNA